MRPCSIGWIAILGSLACGSRASPPTASTRSTEPPDHTVTALPDPPRPIPPPVPPGDDPMARCQEVFASPLDAPPQASVRPRSVASGTVAADRWDPAGFFPRAHAAVPGRVVGVLWSEGYPRDTGDGPGAYMFSFDGESGERVGFFAPGSSQRAAVGHGNAPDGGDVAPFRLLRPGEPNPWSLSAPAHLVELEINSGHGRPALGEGTTGSLFASCVRIDSSVPSSLIERAMQRAWSRFQDAVARRWTIPAHPLPTVTIAPTWRHASGRLEVSILMMVADAPSLLGCAPCAVGNQRCPCAFDGRAIGGRYQYVSGALALENLYEPHATVVSVVAGEVI